MEKFMELCLGPNWNLVVFGLAIMVASAITLVLLYQVYIFAMYVMDIVKMGYRKASSPILRNVRKFKREETFFSLRD